MLLMIVIISFMDQAEAFEYETFNVSYSVLATIHTSDLPMLNVSSYASTKPRNAITLFCKA